jgi:hypothetical protein
MRYANILLIASILILVAVAGCTIKYQPAVPPTTVPTPSVPVIITTSVPTTIVPTPTPNPFPNALSLKTWFPFETGTKWASEATVYRAWINNSYRWYNPNDNQYETKVAPEGKKYLIVFATMVNRGSERLLLPSSNNIYVWYNNAIISPDRNHALPTRISDLPPKVIRIGEIEFSKKLFGTEYVEDFGYSYGQKIGYLNPEVSNAIDGYIIYEVPQSLTPEKTYVEISFNNQDRGVWRLA